MIEDDGFYGWSDAVLANQHVAVRYLTEAGPRVVGFGPADGPNMFAQTPDVSWDTSGGRFHLIGGHRFWYAPEMNGRSDWPDADGLKVEDLDGAVRLVQQADPSGIAKELSVELIPDRPMVRVTHVLRNDGVEPLQVAPWTITQMALGGTGYLPQAVNPVAENPLFPNRGLVLWPYSRWGDERLALGDPFIRIDGLPGDPPLKVGYFNPHGWLAYKLDGWVFIKRWSPAPGLEHADQGSNAEAYVSNFCLELEALAPLKVLDPGGETTHIETWEVWSAEDADRLFQLP